MFTKYFNNNQEYVQENFEVDQYPEENVLREEDIIEEEAEYDEEEAVDEEAVDEEAVEEEADEEEIDEEKLQSKLNYYDEDEDKEDRLYIISIDNIPHLYAKDLKELRTKMWEIANVLLKSSKNESDGYYIFTNNLNEIKIICPYDFFILKYHHVLYELKIDYVLSHTSYYPKN